MSGDNTSGDLDTCASTYGTDGPDTCGSCDGTGLTEEFDNPRAGVTCPECSGEGVS